MKWLWVNGWGVEPDQLKSWASRSFPLFSHTVILPDRLDHFAKGFDHIIGWSWGGYRVLEWLTVISEPESSPSITLVAPFLGFCMEDQLGGKCSRIQVNYLKRWMERNPVAAMKDFYQRAGLTFEIPSGDSEHLVFWISQLDAMVSEKIRLQKLLSVFEKINMRIMVGKKDTIIDSSWMVKNLGAICIESVGHNMEDYQSYI